MRERIAKYKTITIEAELMPTPKPESIVFEVVVVEVVRVNE